MITKIKQSRLEDEWNEACLVVTNKGAYVIHLRYFGFSNIRKTSIVLVTEF